MTKVRITDNGLIQEAGSGFDVETGVVIGHDVQYKSTNITANTTLTRGGQYLISSSNTGLTLTLPKASTVPGALFVFRAVSTGSHILTASQETGTYRGIHAALSGATGGGLAAPTNYERRTSGARVTFPAPNGVSGSSCVLLCDGVNFHMLASSGSMTVDT